MKPKARMKLVLDGGAGNRVACSPRLRSVQELTLLLSLCVLGSVLLSYQLGSPGAAGRGVRSTNDAKNRCAFHGLAGIAFGEVTSGQDQLKTSDLLSQALKTVEEEDLRSSRFDKVVLVGDSQDQVLRYLKAFEALRVRTEIYSPGTDRSQLPSCDSSTLWICLGACGKPGRNCRAEGRRKENHFDSLDEQLGERDALCNTFSTLRRQSADSQRSALPLCFVLPEQAQKLTDVASALALTQTSAPSWLLRPVGSRMGRRVRATQVATAALTDAGLLQRTLSLIFDRGRAVAQQMLVHPLLASRGRPVLVRVFALVTSLVPLRAYIHQAGTAFQGTAMQGTAPEMTTIQMSGKSMPLKHLWRQMNLIYGSPSSGKVWSQITSQTAALLVAAEYEILSRSAALNRSRSFAADKGKHGRSFQLLSFEFALNTTLQPFLWNVNVKPHSLASHNGDGVKARILVDVARVLTARHRVAAQVAQALRTSDVSVGLMCHFCHLSHDICLTRDDLSYLLQSRRERLSMGMFVQVYPSMAAAQLGEMVSSFDQKIQKEALSSTAVQHSSLFDVTKRHQTAQMHKLLLDMEDFYSKLEQGGSKSVSKPTKIERSRREQELRDALSRSFAYEEGEMDCVQDPTALPYLLLLRVAPEQSLAFHPNKTEYRIDVPYEQTTVEVRAKALYCNAEARLDDRLGPARPMNYTLGLGFNRISVVVVDIRHAEARVANAYVLSVFRRERASRHGSRYSAVCGLKQSCGQVIYPKEACGLQAEDTEKTWSSVVLRMESLDACRSGYEDGRWLLPCADCANPDSCVWSMARWAPFRCRYPVVSNASLQSCLDGKKLLFLGDSTNRGVMYYVLMRLNGTLGEWHRSHGIALHAQRLNGGRTAAGFAYYPHFWLPPNRRPTLARTLARLADSMPPLDNSASTVLVVGGVQWLNVKQLSSLTTALKSLGLDKAKIIIKTFGSGFHLRAEGGQPMNLRSQEKLGRTNRELVRRAVELGMEVVDTFNMTSARFMDFTQGSCACHFHKVVSDSLTTYRVEGPVNQAYGDILLSRLCQQGKAGPT
ncbi:cadherin-like and PC-esterase domain-containing protein 1 isoform X2 [Amblyomma americanum]